jgi:methionyl aminopeptidase
MITLKTSEEIEGLYRANRIVADVLDALCSEIKPGVDTLTLDRIARRICREAGAKPAFLDYPGPKTPFPAVICASLNDEVVHGIPTEERVLAEGDILSIDFGVEKDGFYGDSALTVPVGKVSDEAQRLMTITQKSLFDGIEQAREGNRLYDISHAIQSTAESAGFSVVRHFVGHGIGRKMHEPPQIPNFGEPGKGVRLRNGMVFALEPMINAGTYAVSEKDDGWTAVTSDGKLSAHFEHSIAITADGPRILSLRSTEG